MSEAKNIEHEGFVEEVLPDRIRVKIISQSACASCHAKGACTASDMQDKVIDIYESHPDLKTGQKVMILGKQELIFQAVAMAYVIPVVLILGVMLAVFHTTGNEVLAALLSIGILIPYFVGVYFLRNKLQKKFSFTIKHQID